MRSAATVAGLFVLSKGYSTRANWVPNTSKPTRWLRKPVHSWNLTNSTTRWQRHRRVASSGFRQATLTGAEVLGLARLAYAHSQLGATREAVTAMFRAVHLLKEHSAYRRFRRRGVVALWGSCADGR